MKNLTFRNNDQMPILGLGTWKSQTGEVYKAVREAIKIGYRHFDCAAIYGNEKEVGQALSDSIKSGEVTREELWITSKLWNNSHPTDLVIPALKKTLEDLCLDYLDLYLVHWPVCLKPGVTYPESSADFIPLDELPLSETWKGMETCVKQGLTRHIGVSNLTVKKLEGLMATADIKPEMNQIELHPFLQQTDMLSYCKENNVHLTAYSPLGSGDRPAILKDDSEKSLLENPVIMKMAEEKKCSPAQILLGWAMERGTGVIPKSVNPARLAQNFNSKDIKLSGQDMETLAGLDLNARYVRGNLWLIKGSSYTRENLWG